MRRNRRKILHRFYLAVALLGIVLHVGAFAWHPYARSWTDLAEAQLLADAQAAICHDTGLATSEAPGDGSTPGVPERNSDCLVCQSLAHACFAIRTPAGIVLFAPAAPRVVAPTRVARVDGASTMPPRSRGPPHQG